MSFCVTIYITAAKATTAATVPTPPHCTLSSSSMGHWYCSSQPSKKLLSLASCPTSTGLKPVRAATSLQVRDLPVPEESREGGGGEERKGERREESGAENKIIPSDQFYSSTYHHLVYHTLVSQSQTLPLFMRVWLHETNHTSTKVVTGLKTSQLIASFTIPMASPGVPVIRILGRLRPSTYTLAMLTWARGCSNYTKRGSSAK